MWIRFGVDGGQCGWASFYMGVLLVGVFFLPDVDIDTITLFLLPPCHMYQAVGLRASDLDLLHLLVPVLQRCVEVVCVASKECLALALRFVDGIR